MIDLAQLDIGSPVSYLIAILVPALDALIPVLPSETAVIALGVATAGSTDPRIAVLVGLPAAQLRARHRPGRDVVGQLRVLARADRRPGLRGPSLSRPTGRPGAHRGRQRRDRGGGGSGASSAGGRAGSGPGTPVALLTPPGRPHPPHLLRTPPAPHLLHMVCRRTPPMSHFLLRKGGRAYAPVGTPSEGDEPGGARTRGDAGTAWSGQPGA